MANQKRGESRIDLGGNEYLLRYDINAMAILEEEIGGSALSILSSGNEDAFGIRFVRAAIYAGLMHDNRLKRGLTISKVGKLMKAEELSDYAQSIVRGLVGFYGGDPDKVDAATEDEGIEPDPLPVGASESPPKD